MASDYNESDFETLHPLVGDWLERKGGDDLASFASAILAITPSDAETIAANQLIARLLERGNENAECLSGAEATHQLRQSDIDDEMDQAETGFSKSTDCLSGAQDISTRDRSDQPAGNIESISLALLRQCEDSESMSSTPPDFEEEADLDEELDEDAEPDERPGYRNYPSPPAPTDLLFAISQVWHNEGSRTKSEWAANLSSSSISAGFDPAAMLLHHLFFNQSPRRMRERIARYVTAGKLSVDFKKWFDVWSEDMNTNTRIALVTKAIHGKFEHISKGQSANEQQVYEGYIATLTLNDDHTAPSILKLYHKSQSKPMMVLSGFVENSKTKALFNEPVKEDAPGWTGYYDPAQVGIQARRELKALRHHKAKQKALTDFNPTTQWGTYIREFLGPLAESVVEYKAHNESMRSQMERMYRRMELMQAKEDAMKAQMETMQAQITKLLNKDI